MAGIGDLSKAGYSFVGWLIDNRIYWSGATYVMPEKNVTAYAIWSDHAGLQKKRWPTAAASIPKDHCPTIPNMTSASL